MTLRFFYGWPQKNNRAPLLYYIKLFASFRFQPWIQTGVTVRKHSIWVKIVDFLSRVTLKFDGLPWKTIGHLSYTTSSFVHHFKAIGEFQTGVTVRKHSIQVKIGDFFGLYDFEIWQMTLKNNRVPLLYNVKLCPSFQSHRWIKTWVTVRKCSIQIKIGDFLSFVTLKFHRWPCKTIGHLFYTTLSFVHHFKAISEFKLDLQFGNAQFG